MTQQTDAPQYLQPPDADDVLMNSGAPKAWAWGGPQFTVPVTLAGKVVSKPVTYHAREFDPTGQGQGKPKFTQNGRPIWGIGIDIQTMMRESVEDTGIRRLYADKIRLLNAIREAVQAHGLPGVQVGGYLSVTWTGTEPGKGSIDASTFSATYTPAGQVTDVPTPQAATPYQAPNIGNGQPAPQWAQPQPTATPVAATSIVPSKVVTSTTAAALANAGVDLTGYTIVPG
jgi:hypothetical protein